MKKSGDNSNSKQALLDAASRLFALHGTDDVKLSEVAEAAGVDACMVHYYFGGRRGLVNAVVERAMERWNRITLHHYFEQNAKLLETREGQQVFIAGMVEKIFRALNTNSEDDDDPDPGNVLFLQLLQHPSASRNKVIAEHIKPLVTVFYEVYQKITGSRDFDSAFCWFLILMCPFYMSMVNPGMIDPLYPDGKVPHSFNRRLQFATTQLLLHGLGL